MCGQFEKLSRVLVKDDQQIGENVDHELSQLDEKFFASPALALSAASDAISAMARLARTGVMSALDVLHQFDRHTIDVIDRNEDHIRRAGRQRGQLSHQALQAMSRRDTAMTC